jgi:hypothetical protein
MSWMTRGGSSSALGQSLQLSALSEFAQCAAAHTRGEPRSAVSGDSFADLGGGCQLANTKGPRACKAGRGVRKKGPPDEGGARRSEGFG